MSKHNVIRGWALTGCFVIGVGAATCASAEKKCSDIGGNDFGAPIQLAAGKIYCAVPGEYREVRGLPVAIEPGQIDPPCGELVTYSANKVFKDAGDRAGKLLKDQDNPYAKATGWVIETISGAWPDQIKAKNAACAVSCARLPKGPAGQDLDFDATLVGVYSPKEINTYDYKADHWVRIAQKRPPNADAVNGNYFPGTNFGPLSYMALWRMNGFQQADGTYECVLMRNWSSIDRGFQPWIMVIY